jgi:hypothetical protein
VPPRCTPSTSTACADILYLMSAFRLHPCARLTKMTSSGEMSPSIRWRPSSRPFPFAFTHSIDAVYQYHAQRSNVRRLFFLRPVLIGLSRIRIIAATVHYDMQKNLYAVSPAACKPTPTPWTPRKPRQTLISSYELIRTHRGTEFMQFQSNRKEIFRPMTLLHRGSYSGRSRSSHCP